MIAVDVFSTVGEIGLMAHISTGVVSETSWKCAPSKESKESLDWISPDFNDSHWPAAISYFKNDNTARNDQRDILQMADFPPHASWITTSEREGKRMHCRRSLY